MSQFVKLYNMDVLDGLAHIPSNSVDLVMTSPPYWGLRDYGVGGQIGMEASPEEYVTKMVAVFHAVHRVLKPSGTLWLNLGDSYCGTGDKGGLKDPKFPNGRNGQSDAVNRVISGLKSKDLVGIPWRVALALQADGWYLRQDIIWAKPNPMPESVTDRCTKSHEYIFLLTKTSRYFFDNEAVKESAVSPAGSHDRAGSTYMNSYPGGRFSPGERSFCEDGKRNKHSVWTVTTKPFVSNHFARERSHFAMFPLELCETPIKAGLPDEVCLECGKNRERKSVVISTRVTDAMKACGSNRHGEYRGEAKADYAAGLAQNPSDTKRRILESMSKVKNYYFTDCGCKAGWRGGVALDPFAGSGSFGEAVRKLKPNASLYLIELNSAYVPVIKERVGWGQQVLGLEPIEWKEVVESEDRTGSSD